MKKLFTTFSSLLLASTLFATTIQVATYEELATAVSTTSVNGDVIELTTAGVYKGTADLEIAKKITISAASGLASKPELEGFGFKLKNEAAFTIEGIKAYYDAPGSGKNTDSKYFITAVAETAIIDHIKIINCEISNYGRGMLRADKTAEVATIGEILIDNCILTNLSSFNAGYSIVAAKTALVTTGTIRNTTIHNCISGIWLSGVTTSPINFTMENVTVYNCGATDIIPAGATAATAATKAKELLNFAANPGSNYTIANSIFWGTYNPEYTSTAIKIGATDGNVKLINSVVNTNGTALSATWTENTQITTITNFSLSSDLKSISSTAITSIGDPRGYASSSNAIKANNANQSFKFFNNNITTPLSANIEIYNIIGKKVISATNTTSTDLTGLSAGIYILKITTEGQTTTEKIIIE